MSYKLKFHKYVVAGAVTDVKEYKRTDGIFTFYDLHFNYFNSKMMCNAKVTFSSDKEEEDLYKPATRFVSKLDYVKSNRKLD